MGIISDYIGQSVGRQTGYRDHAQSRGVSGDPHSAGAEYDARNSTMGSARSAGRTSAGDDGQRRSTSFYAPGMESGMRAYIPENHRVGQLSGAEQRQMVGICHPNVMTEHTEGAGPTPGVVTGDNRGVS